MTWFPKKLAPLLIALPLLYVAFLVFRNEAFGSNPITGEDSDFFSGFEYDYSSPPTREQLLDGLLAPDHFRVASCLSRYQSALYRKSSSPHKPSSYLLSKLRDYEKLHSSCGPHTDSFKRSTKQLKFGSNDEEFDDHNSTETDFKCKYVVWVAKAGLGNRILSITSAFLYALLTNRVLLINQEPDMADLFCQPFPNTTWLLPTDFPLSLKYQLYWFTKNSPHRYGNLLKTNKINVVSTLNKLLPLPLPSYLYLYLVSDYDHHDKLFFCDEHQTFLGQVPWLIMKSDVYFLPSLFLMTSFQDELNKLFPDKETVFHHLGRYLFHPSNQVWRLVTKFYEQFLANAHERIGIQIRVFNQKESPFGYVMDQILSCTLKEKLLPEVDMARSVAAAPAHSSGQNISKAVLVTSLYPDFFKKMNSMYSKHPTSTGELVAVYQPSHESKQRSKSNLHNKKAWAEIKLLSMTDVLVTSAWSTFGYVAHGLAGKKPWFLYKIDRKIPDPACGQAMSMEPCFHAPPVYDCKAKTVVDTATLVPHLRHCEDIYWGIKLFNISQ